MEIKTLQDIDWRGLAIPDTVDIIEKDTLRHGKIALYPSTIIKHLKKEAIKRIKNFRKPCDINILNKDCGHLDVHVFKNNRACCISCGSTIEHKRKMSPEDEPEVTFIKEFFNIIEEDLV